MKRKAKSPRRKLKDKLEKLVREIVKKRDDYTCQKSGQRVEGANCHCSHVIPRSQSLLLSFDPLNLKVLSYHNHINWWHKNPLEAAEWFKTKFPKRWEYLKARKNIKKSIKDYELEEMIINLTKQLKEMV